MIVNKKIMEIISCTLFFFTALFIMIFLNSVLPVYFATMILQIYAIVKFRRHVFVFIFLVYMLTYFTPLYQHYVNGILLTPWTQNFVGTFDEKTLLIYCLFYYVFFIGMLFFNKNNKKIEFKKFKTYDNKWVYIFSIIGIILTIILGHTGQAELGSYGTGQASSTILNEYGIMFFLFAYIFSNDKKIKKGLILLMFLIFSLVNFAYGDRIAVLQVGLLIFILFFRKINWKLAIIAMFLVVNIFNFVATVRTLNTESSIKISNINTNQTQVFNSSVTYIRIIDEKIITNEQRVESVLAYTSRLFSTGKWSELSNLSRYTQTKLTQQGGGFIATYFYVWFGWIGVIFIGVIVSKLISSSAELNDNINSKSIFYIVLLCMFPRWLVYDPISMVKVPLYATIMWILFIFVKRITSKRKG